MNNLITTGELAKKCNVSVRTVQFYDKKGLLKPQSLSEGKRRMFSDEEIIKLKCICLYKSLGFSLDEIETILENNSNVDFFEKVLNDQEEKLDNQIKRFTENKKKLELIKNQVDETKKVEIKSVEDLDSLVHKKTKYRKTEIMTYIFMACYILIVIAGFPIAASIGGFSEGIFGIITVILLLGLVYYHKECNAYLCPECHEKFTISLFKDLLSLNGASQGKYLKCPKCGRKGWFKETFKQ